MKSLKKLEKFFDYYIKRITEYPLRELKDQISNETHNQLIPPCVYQTWENKFFGKTHYQEILKFRDVNKDLSFILFDKTARDEYMEKYWSSHEIYHVYKNVKFGVIISEPFLKSKDDNPSKLAEEPELTISPYFFPNILLTVFSSFFTFFPSTNERPSFFKTFVTALISLES